MFYYFRRRQDNAFSPASYGTRLKAWWKPTADKVNSGSVADNDPVSTLADSSANARDLAQSLTKRPLWDDTITANGYSIFDGANDLLAYSAADSISTASSGEFYCVIRPSSVTGTQAIFGTADESVANKLLSIQLNGAYLEIAQNDGGTEDRVTATTTAMSTGTSYVIGVISTGTAWELRVNGVSQALTVASGSNSGDWFGDTSARDSATLGARKTTSENTFLNGYIGEAFLIDP